VRQRLARVEQARVDAPEQALRPQCLAAMSERDDDALAGPDEGTELVLGFGQPACGESRPLRLEAEGLVLRQRIELGHSLERDRSEVFLLPDAADVVGLPHEIRRSFERPDEVLRDMAHGLSLGQAGFDQVGAPLRSRMDRRAVNRVQRALRERREGAHRLELVSEPLEPQRLPARRREDVDEPAADGELAALFDPLNALVPGHRERLGDGVDPAIVVGCEVQGLGPHARRRHRLGNCCGGGADEASARQDVERTRPLSHEVRRRLEARAPTYAAAREQRDPLGAEEPRGRLRCVAGIGVLWEEHDEPPLEPFVQRREQEGQRRLGDACACRQRSRETFEALVLDELRNQDVEHRSVHHERRNARFRGGHGSRRLGLACRA
jgi:hypothetical protein